MALEPIKLDDLTWSGMVAAIRNRIVAVSAGKWTLHAPVDPGVTLLELFAWLLEQRLYWLDQLPDPLIRADLQLLGLEAPKPARPAATVLALSDVKKPPRAFLELPILYELSLLRRTPPLIFSTDAEITIMPVLGTGLNISGKDRTADLEQGRIIRIFPADGSPGEVQVRLNLGEAIPDHRPASPLGILFELEVPGRISPQWSPEAVNNIPPPAEVTWWYPSQRGKLVQFNSVDDGTAGFRRSGVVRLPFPIDWLAEPPAPGQTGVTYVLTIRVSRTTFTAPPRLVSLVPNAVIARHRRRTRLHCLQQTWLPLPGNVADLSALPQDQPIKDYPPLAEGMTLWLKERDQLFHLWQATDDLTFRAPEDRVFVVDRASSLLRFGDGLTGRLPVLANDQVNLKVQYFVGGGVEGNLGANLEWEGKEDKDVQARNVVPAEYGAEAEPLDAARERAAAQLRRRNRAVTCNDYEEIACTTPGVTIRRAHAAVGYHPAYPCYPVPGAVTVFPVPDAPREEVEEIWVETAFVPAPLPDPGALAMVRARLAEARLLTSEVFVCPPRYRPVALMVAVKADTFNSALLKKNIEQRLQTYLDPLVGGDQGQGWGFGDPLRPSTILREAQLAVGDGGEAVGVSIQLLDTTAPAESCTDVKIGPHDLVELRRVTVNLSSAGISRGGLR